MTPQFYAREGAWSAAYTCPDDSALSTEQTWPDDSAFDLKKVMNFDRFGEALKARLKLDPQIQAAVTFEALRDEHGNLPLAPAAFGLVNRRKSPRDFEGEFTCGVRIYNQDVRVSIRPKLRRSKPGRSGGRGKQKGFSDASRRRCIHKLNNCDARWVAFACLTYPAEFPDAETVKKHLDNWLERLRRKFPKGVKYFWVLELQERGALHIHILIDKFVPKAWLSQSWYEVVGSNDPKHLAAGTKVQAVRNRVAAMAYMISNYVTKATQKDFQHWVGRVWGCSRTVKTPFEAFAFQGSHKALSRMLRPMLKALQHRFKGFSWRGFSFSFYGGAKNGLAHQTLALGLSLTPHESVGSSWSVALN